MRNARVTGFEAPVMEFSESLVYIRRLLENKGNKNGDIVILPEKCIRNVFVEGSQNYEDLVNEFRQLSSEFGICLVPGSLNIQRNSGLYNSSPVFNRGELLGWQDKIVPFSQEKQYYKPGSEIRTFDTGSLKFGIQVCYDLDFPFITKIQAAAGVDVILNPSLIVADFHNMWYLYVKARSLENRIPVISVNSISEPFRGGSISTYFSVRERGVLLRTRRSSDNCITCSVNREMVRALSTTRIHEDPGTYRIEENH